MKKKLLSIVMVVVVITSLAGCTKTKTVTYTDENGNTTTTTTTNGETTTVTESIDDDSISDIEPIAQESEYTVVESEDGYRVTFNPEYFVYDNTGEYEGKESVYIRCTIDKENEYENYIDVNVAEDYTAEELIEGIAYQSGTEATTMNIVFANGKEYDAYYCERYITDTFKISFYAIEGKDAPYLIETGSHIYSDDDEYAYYVAGEMEKAFLDIELEN